ncbi:RNA polymerase sigma factor [Mucilaginibacter sp. UR6-11]|uniref:RNA polymerase sigma factor n=1 Tax=Mucilaginibacter sp. UR6-11 TaxID=1435644 RepID=UPI001E52ED3C|nr:sigma-70 family RNA polymerase sigma factor [Mucilaginibacter sp. UR6-11]MCC8426084.1 sigma-70 family RNA polymerase sigma factor [Mucilaginibacter sp. UR6-11]
MDDQTLSILISGCMANKRKAQEELYLIFYPGMYRLCMRYLRSDDLVPEALNTGFLKVFTKITSYHEAKGNLKGWISAIMIRSCIDLQRSELRFQHYEDITEANNTPHLSPDALDRLYAADLLAYVRALPPASQMVFNLYEVDGFDHGEIATILGISASTSRWHLTSAKQQLRQLINQKN